MNYELRKKTLLNCFIVILLVGFFVLFINTNLLRAADDNTVIILGKTINTDSLDGFVKIAIAIAAWILGITGSLALLFFIYGGFMFLISAGSSERVQKAKQIIIGAVVGVVIVLTSFLIINFVLTSLGADQFDGKPWYQLTK